MRVTTIAPVLLLPLLAVAEDAQSTTTQTALGTLTQTVTLKRIVATTTATWIKSANSTSSYPIGTGAVNGTASFHASSATPTVTIITSNSASSTTSSSAAAATTTSITSGAASAHNAASIMGAALLGVAGMAAAALL